MTLPSPNDVVAFVIFFFPGFITLLLSSKLCRVRLKQRSDLEKIVLSSIFSIVSFLIVGVSPQVEDITIAILDVNKLLFIFLVSIILALVLWIIVKIWSALDDILSVRLEKCWSKLGLTYRSNEKGSSYILRQFYDAREKNALVIFTSSGDIYKGSFEGYAISPLEIVLCGTEKNPIMQFTENQWKEIEGYILYFFEKDIKRISAIGLIGETN